MLPFRREFLIAGPWVGELGWELMGWQGYVRKLRERYQRTIVISYPNREFLYEQCEFFPHDLQLQNSGFAYGKLPMDDARALVKHCADQLSINSYDSFFPFQLNKITRLLIGGQKFVKLRPTFVTSDKFDVAFHFRNLLRPEDGDEKNYPQQAAAAIVNDCVQRGLRICHIGDPRMSHNLDGCEDRRSVDLNETVATICSSRIVVGGSSGPMHLAHLCDVPIIVWAASSIILERYFGDWNPFGTRTFVTSDTTWKPNQDSVLSTVYTALDQLNLVNTNQHF